MEHWNTGMMEYWSIGILECWTGTMEYWNIGKKKNTEAMSQETGA
jgi:hypothetical protein